MSKYTASSQQVSIILWSKLTDDRHWNQITCILLRAGLLTES